MINYHRVLETDQYWGDVNYEGVVEAQGSILRSSSMWMVSQLSSELSRFVFSGLLFLATSQSSVDNTGNYSKKIDFELLFWHYIITLPSQVQLLAILYNR